MRLRTSAAAVMLLFVAGCSEPVEPTKMVSVQMSNRIDEENRVYSPGEYFSKSSTIYMVIKTEGSGEATLEAVWKDEEGNVLTTQKKTINPTEPTYHEFHYKPEGDWEAGAYFCDITINGGAMRTRRFEIG